MLEGQIVVDGINRLDIGWRILAWALIVIAVVCLAWGGATLNKKVFSKIQEKHRGIHLAFFEKINSFLIVCAFIVLAVSAFSGAQAVWQTIFGGTAIISAVLAFAAQDIIKDILAGLMISLYKPFEIGDRIVLEDGTAGVVENITLRHVVLVGLDSQHTVIPNSKLNAMQLNNFSFESELLSVQFRFSVGYDSDLKKVKRVIAQAVEDSAYSIPGKSCEDGTTTYGPVYFISFADSALIMAVTVFFERKIDPEIVINDINTRVREALVENQIEIPYNYINVVSKS
ncbi:MAG: mechanosensitive ion channel family protein [Clostridia bacterium]|nr:mechanosensitive ion channel family protein [Clostridia bacterium]